MSIEMSELDFRINVAGKKDYGDFECYILKVVCIHNRLHTVEFGFS